MQTHKAEHLPENKRIRMGGYYTPEKLVYRVYGFVRPYFSCERKKSIIFDSAGGCGAFLSNINGNDYRIADCDGEACDFLKQRFDAAKVFHTNSLVGVDRNKYLIPPSTPLIMVGNPPYNDITSEFRSGEKGENICDEDLRDRDLGVSFLRSYNKLKADIVCILHPLSYLIKEANFKRLREFRENYKLAKAEIFSSALFAGTGFGKFPIIVALYERNISGMDFDYIRNFRFNILDSNDTFVLSKFQTTDGYINKYPPRKNDAKKSPIGLYYYTFRDFNSLKKNTSFMTREHPNGIVVTLENFYKYSYLYSLKSLFNPDNSWLYGNLSPLANVEDVERNKNLYVSYAVKTNRVFEQTEKSLPKTIMTHYKIKMEEDVNKIEETIKGRLNSLV
ncbi:MAG: hypothetical protein V1927_05105 [Candidatus Omnitrophota bacterium]